MNIRNASIGDIVDTLYLDTYYQTVAYEYMADAVRQALFESRAKSIKALSAYIKQNLI